MRNALPWVCAVVGHFSIVFQLYHQNIETLAHPVLETVGNELPLQQNPTRDHTKTLAQQRFEGFYFLIKEQ